MKHLSLFVTLCLIVVIYPNCKKNDDGCNPRPVSSEADQIKAFAAANGIVATAHASGMYYEILDPGTGATPTVNSTIFIKYTGKLTDTNGTIFDQQQDATKTGWTLGSLIEGWKVGIPLIKKGGHIRLIVPSAMAYGCNDYYSIPGNSVLFFDVELIDVK